MKVSDLAAELRATVSDIQRTARKLEISAPSPAFELSTAECAAIRAHGVITVADVAAARAQGTAGAASPAPATAVPPPDPARLRAPAVDARPHPPRGQGAVRLLAHEAFFDWLGDRAVEPRQRKRAYLVLRQLLARGRPNSVKAVQGAAQGWRRTALGGNTGHQYYLWWAPKGAPPVAHLPMEDRTVLVRVVRHHDQTDQPLDAGDPSAWVPLSASDIVPGAAEEVYPFSAEQVRAATATGPIKLIKGHPGAGKTTTLMLASSHCVGDRALYVTYSARLRQEAKSELAAFGPVGLETDVLTFEEVLDAFDGATGAERRLNPATAASELDHLLAAQRDKRSAWDGHPAELYAELHAHFVGRALPIAFRGAAASPRAHLEEATYVQLRTPAVGDTAARAAVHAGLHLAGRGALPQLFPNPYRARKALDACLGGAPVPARLRDFAWLVIDEVQDLTLVEQQLLVELARRCGLAREQLPGVIIAGDEGQTVRPTDFEWGPLADLLHERLGAKPEQHELTGNVRSPRGIAGVVNRSWELYRALDKSERPRGYAEAQVDETTVGSIIHCRVGGGEDLERLLTRLDHTAGAALVYPGFAVPIAFGALSRDVLTSETAKGLDFQLVAVLDPSKRLAALDDLATKARTGSPLARLWARTLADQLRVAISRSTETLLLVDRDDVPAGPPLIERLYHDPSGQPLEGVMGSMEVDDLLAFLEQDDDDATTRVTTYVDDVRKVLLDAPERALRKATHACGLLGGTRTPGHVRDEALRREVWQLRATAALLVALDTRAEERFREANRYYHKAEQPQLAEAALQLLHLATFHELALTSALTLSVQLEATLAAAPELDLAIRQALFRWCKEAARRALPSTPAARKSLDAAIALLAVESLTARGAELEDILEELRGRCAAAAMDDALPAEALTFYRKLRARDWAGEAACLEALASFGEASVCWETAGDVARALACARRVPDLARAGALAAQVDREVAARLAWAAALIERAEEPLEGGAPLTAEEHDLIRRRVMAALDQATAAPPAIVASAPAPRPSRGKRSS